MALTLTINGISGNISDWEPGTGQSITPTPDATRIRTKNIFPVQPNTTFICTLDPGYNTYLFFYDFSGAFVAGFVKDWTTSTFTTPSNVYFARAIVRRSDIAPTITPDEILIAKPMLNIGTSPVPYSQKTGDRIVMPVPKSNIFDGQLEAGTYISGTGAKSGISAIYRSVNFTPVIGGKTYSIMDIGKTMLTTNTRIFQFDSNKQWIRDDLGTTITLDQNTAYITFHSISLTSSNMVVFVEQGPFVTFDVQVNKKAQRQAQAQTGLSFNGTVDYITAPAMTRTISNLEATIDFMVTKFNTDGVLFGMESVWKVGIGTGQLRLLTGDNWASNILNANSPKIVLNKHMRVKATYDGQFKRVYLDDVLIGELAVSGVLPIRFNPFSIFTYVAGSTPNPTGFLGGIVYNAKVIADGEIVYNYDFENPDSIQGTTVLENPKNLIPGFEDPRWSLYPSVTQVLGENYLRLNATSAFQQSVIILPVVGGASYCFSALPTTGRYIAIWKDNADVNIGSLFVVGSTLTAPSNAVNLRFIMDSTTSGTFDFIKPQLYQLTGNEGTLNGNPDLIKKQSKRTLYAER